MKLAFLIPALGLAQSALAAENAGPYNSVYEQYCGNGQTQGNINVGHTVFHYTCDTGNSVISKPPVQAASLYECANLCVNDGACNQAVWYRNNGKCWINVVGAPKTVYGQISITKGTNTNQIDTVPPVCNSPNTRQVTKVDGQGWFLACGTRFGVTRPNQVGKVDSLERCMDICNKRHGCRSIMWNRNDKYCYVTDGNSLSGEVTQNSAIDAAIRLD